MIVSKSKKVIPLEIETKLDFQDDDWYGAFHTKKEDLIEDFPNKCDIIKPSKQ